nr:alkyl sulfatase C-terminal domain-containing protein [Streptomyces sp. BA2]
MTPRAAPKWRWPSPSNNSWTPSQFVSTAPRAWDEELAIDLVLSDERRRHRLTLHNGALTHRATDQAKSPNNAPGLSLALTKPQLLGVLAGKGLEGVTTEGDQALLTKLFSYVTEPDKSFGVVTP